MNSAKLTLRWVIWWTVAVWIIAVLLLGFLGDAKAQVTTIQFKALVDYTAKLANKVIALENRVIALDAKVNTLEATNNTQEAVIAELRAEQAQELVWVYDHVTKWNRLLDQIKAAQTFPIFTTVIKCADVNGVVPGPKWPGDTNTCTP